MTDTREPDKPVQLYAAMRCGGEIRPTTRRWLWPGRIPRGAVTVLAGDPGAGKSILTVEIAARVTTSRAWPGECGRPRPHGEETQAGTPAPPIQTIQSRTRTSALPGETQAGTPTPPIQTIQTTQSRVETPAVPGFVFPPGVVFVSAEDAVDDVLLPRLAAAGANTNRCTFVEGVSPTPSFPPAMMPEPHEIEPLQLPDHIERLAEAAGIIKDATPLIILDPITSFMPSGGSVGKVFRSLSRLAQDLDLAILAVCHLSKARAYRALYRVRGSLEYVSIARSVLLLSVDETDPGRRVLHQIKSAYGPPSPPLAFRLTPAATVAWEPIAADAVSAELLDLPAERQTAVVEARDWLADALANGPRAGREILKEAAAAGISQATLYRARQMLGVRSVKGEWQMAKWATRTKQRIGS